MAHICPECGTENVDKAYYCFNCGAEIYQEDISSLEPLNNRYKILETLKSGIKESVYKARDLQTETMVVVRKILAAFKSDQERRTAEQLFLERGRALAELNHSGLPRVMDFFMTRDPMTNKTGFFLVTSFIEGEDFETLEEDDLELPLPVSEALDYFRQILEILSYLHSRQAPVVVLEIKPSSVMLKDDEISLLNFGVSHMFSAQQKGVVMGTPGYAAPEQYKGFAEPRSDLYSLGAFMHFLLTGEDPLDPDVPLFSFEPAKSLNPAVPDYLDYIIASMLELSVENRPSSADQVLEMLESVSVDSLSANGSEDEEELSQQEQSELFTSICRDEIAEVKEFLRRGNNVNIKNKKGTTPLHKAAQCGNLDIVTLLIESGARLDIKDRDG